MIADNSIIRDTVASIKKSEYPLCLFGKGTTTNRVVDMLKEHGVDIEGVLVNRDYFGAGGDIKGVPMLVFEDYLSKTPCNVMICTGDWDENTFSEEYKTNIQNLYALDLWGLLAIGGGV